MHPQWLMAINTPKQAERIIINEALHLVPASMLKRLNRNIEWCFTPSAPYRSSRSQQISTELNPCTHARLSNLISSLPSTTVGREPYAGLGSGALAEVGVSAPRSVGAAVGPFGAAGVAVGALAECEGAAVGCLGAGVGACLGEPASQGAGCRS